MESQSPVLAGLRDMVPFSLGIFASGTVYGVLSRSGHLTMGETMTMSALVFAGSSQFVALELLKQGAAWLAHVPAPFLVNMRQVLYGLSLGPYLKGTKAGKSAWLAHGLVDENYAVTMVAFDGNRGSPSYFMGAGMGAFGPWIASSLAGFFLAAIIHQPFRWGLDFAFNGALTGLLVAQIKSWWILGVVVVSALSALAAQLLLGPNWAIPVAALTACLMGLITGEV